MNKPLRSNVLSIAGCLLLVMVCSSCKDSAAERRAEVQAQIAAAGDDLRQVTMNQVRPEDPEFDNVRRQLQGITSSINTIREAEPGQLAAKSRIASTALRELGVMSLDEARAIEQRHHMKRSEIMGQLDAIGELNALAAAAEGVNTQQQRDSLGQVRTSAQTMLTEFDRQVSELNGPISERVDRNEKDATEVARLQEQANTLRRRASAEGYAAGFVNYERAVGLDRQADRIQYQMSQRDIDLQYGLQPEHTLASARANQMRSILDAATASETDLGELERTSGEIVTITRRDITVLGGDIEETWAELVSEVSGDLTDLYAAAQNDLDRSATESQRAAREGSKSGGSARRGQKSSADALGEARIHELLGRMHLQRANAAAERRFVLQRIAASGLVPETAVSYDAQAKHAAGEYQEATEAAIQSLEQARTQLAGINGGELQAELNELQRGLDAALKRLTGQPDSPVDSRPAASPAGGRAPARSVDAGASSPEMLVSILENMSDLDGIQAYFDNMLPLSEVDGLDPQIEQFFQGSMSMMDHMGRLDEALQSRFGKRVSDVPALSGGMMTALTPPVTSAKIQGVAGDAGAIEVTINDGTTQSVPITRLGERWYFGSTDADAFLAGMMGGAGGGVGADGALDPAALQMMQGLSEMLTAMGRMIGGIAGEVESGSYPSFDDFSDDLNERLQNTMGQMGGMPGSGG